MVPRVGQKVPNFTLPDSEKKARGLSEIIGGGNAVIAFFPFAFSGTCDREMCTFRDDLSKFGSLHAQIVGISVDSVFTLKMFGQTYGLEFPLLSDFNKKVSRSYGVLQEQWVAFDYKGVSKRAIFVVDGKGILRYRWVADAPSDEPPYSQIINVLGRLG